MVQPTLIAIDGALLEAVTMCRHGPLEVGLD